jgi:hypothetical protein
MPKKVFLNSIGFHKIEKKLNHFFFQDFEFSNNLSTLTSNFQVLETFGPF